MNVLEIELQDGIVGEDGNRHHKITVREGLVKDTLELGDDAVGFASSFDLLCKRIIKLGDIENPSKLILQNMTEVDHRIACDRITAWELEMMKAHNKWVEEQNAKLDAEKQAEKKKKIETS